MMEPPTPLPLRRPSQQLEPPLYLRKEHGRKFTAILALLLTSSASSISLSLLTSRARPLPLTWVPLVSSLSLCACAVPVVLWKIRRRDALVTAMVGDSAGWTLGALGSLMVWMRAGAAGRVDFGVLQLVELFGPFMMAILLPRIGLFPTTTPASIIACALCIAGSLLLIPTPVLWTRALCAIVSTGSTVLYLGHFKKLLDHRPEWHRLLFSTVIPALAFSAALAAVGSPKLMSQTAPFAPVLDFRQARFVKLFAGCEALHVVSLAYAVGILETPLTLLLLNPVRTLLLLSLSFKIPGLPSGLGDLTQILLVCAFATGAIFWVDEELQTILVGTFSIFCRAGHESLGEPPHSSPPPQYEEIKRTPLFRLAPAFSRPSSFDIPPKWSSRSTQVHTLAGVFIAAWVGQCVMSTLTSPASASRISLWGRQRATLDIVFAYYNEPIDTFAETITYLRTRPEIAAMDTRLFIYVKHEDSSLDTIALHTGAHEVHRMSNIGREGGTYLRHIMRHYNASIGLPWVEPEPFVYPPPPNDATPIGLETSEELDAEEAKLGDKRANSPVAARREERIDNLPTTDGRGLADYTLFMQPHLSWHWLARPHLGYFDAQQTGYLSLGPYLTSNCGVDGMDNGEFPRMRDIFALFRERICPPTLQLSTYAGQFIVSRRRILANSYAKYVESLKLLEAPDGHWIHKDGDGFNWRGMTDDTVQGASTPQAPFFGHALERSWPMIFGCDDLKIAQQCTDAMRSSRGRIFVSVLMR